MPSTVTYTNSSGSGKVRVYPAGDVHSSRSPSVHSPTSSESRSSSQFSDWTHLSEDEIDPSESASRPPRPSRSRRHHTEARPAPSRHHSSRYEQDEPPRQHRSHRHRSSRHQSHESHDHRDRHDSRRHPSDGSSSGTVELHDEFYGRRGPPTQPPFPPSGAYRHGSGPIPSSHGGFPPGMPGPSAYADPFQPQALVHRSQHDPYGYPTQGNPFAPGPSAPNPFSPMESTHSSYFQTEPQQPPMSQPHRPGPPSQRHSMYGHGPSGSTAYGSELMVSPYGYPGMHGMPHMMQGYPMPAPSPYSGYPSSHVASPAPPQPKEEKKEEPKEVVKEVIVEKPDEATLKELGELRELIKKTEEERVAREQAAIAAAAAKKAKEEQEALQKKEVAAASAAAKEAAEKAAEEAAKAAKEESDKKLAEAEAARAELEKKQKELEEVVKKNEPEPDMLKAPIKFKDAVGRKFSFPWHLCKTWKGMEGLIKQAFLHVDVIGQHVQEGHYDLMGPDGEIILPQVWDTMIKPDWEVSMHMWPIPETPEKKKKKKEEPEEPPLVDEHGHPLGPDPYGPTLDQILAMNAQAAAGKDPAKKAKKKDKSAKRASAHIVDVPPAAAAAPPPAAFPPGLDQATYDALLAAQAQQGPMVVDVAPGPEAAPKVKQKKKLTGLQAWMVGAQPRPSKKDDEERDLSASNHSHSHSHHAATAPVTIARRRRSTAGSSWTTASASPPAKVVATAEQGTSCAVM